MKNLKIVVLAVLPLLFMACTDEYSGNSSVSNSTMESARMGIIGPENPENPFDSAGVVYDEFIEILLEARPTADSVAAIAALVDSTEALHPEWGLPFGNQTLSSSLPTITLLLNSAEPLADAIAGSGLEAAAKLGLSELSSQVSLNEGAPYEEIHALMVAYEADILSDSSISSYERQRLLEIASIARYSLYRKKRKDKDWETSVSIAGAISGSDEGLSLAMRMAVAVGICKKQGIPQ